MLGSPTHFKNYKCDGKALRSTSLKEQGHAILGNFSTNQRVIKLITALNKGKSSRDVDEQNWRALKWIAFA